MADDVAQLPVTEQLNVSVEESQAPGTVEIEDQEPASMDVEDSETTGEPADNISNNAETDVTDDIHVDAAIIDKLTEGTLGLFLPNLQKAKGSINEVLHNQEVLIETIQQENAKFDDSVATKKLTDTMITARQYHTKLVNLKKEMATLMDRSTKLKRRAVKLQQQKQKEELQRAQQKEREQEKERALTAKVAKQSKDTKTEKEPS